MPLILSIFSCDFCPEIVTLKTPEDWEQFENTWSEGIHTYCPKCKDLPAVAELIRQERQVMSEALSNFSAGSVLDAEIIL